MTLDTALLSGPHPTRRSHVWTVWARQGPPFPAFVGNLSALTAASVFEACAPPCACAGARQWQEDMTPRTEAERAIDFSRPFSRARGLTSSSHGGLLFENPALLWSQAPCGVQLCCPRTRVSDSSNLINLPYAIPVNSMGQLFRWASVF